MSRNATSVALQYLQLSNAKTDAGIEFILHQPSIHQPVRCGLTLALHGQSARLLQDPMGNRLFLHPELGAGSTVILRSCNPSSSSELLYRLGFRQDSLSPQEVEALRPVVSNSVNVWSLSTALLPQRSLRIIL